MEREDEARSRVMMPEAACMDLTVPKWFGSGAPRRARREHRWPAHHKLETLAVAALGRETLRAKPTSAGQALEEENVMQSTDGSRPKGLLT
jgi:hypothetical protein